jgi:hypothetical protein
MFDSPSRNPQIELAALLLAGNNAGHLSVSTN